MRCVLQRYLARVKRPFAAEAEWVPVVSSRHVILFCQVVDHQQRAADGPLQPSYSQSPTMAVALCTLQL